VGVPFSRLLNIVKTTSTYDYVPILVFWVLSLITTGSGCEPKGTNKPQHEGPQAMMNIDEVIKKHADSLMTIPGVVGVYHGLDEKGSSCLKVMVIKINPEVERRIPKMLEGYAVVIEESGEIRPMKQ